MFRLVLVFALVACFQFFGLTSSSFSQNQQQNTKSDFQIIEDIELDKIIDRLNSELALSLVQQKQIRAIYESTNSTRIMNMSNWKSFKEYQSEVKKVLTPEQWKKFYRPLPPEGTPIAPVSGSLKEEMFEHLTSELKLSTDQQKKIRTLFETFYKKSHSAIEQSNSLDYCRKLEEKRTTDIKKVLTPEQQKKYEAMGKKVQNGNNSPRLNIMPQKP